MAYLFLLAGLAMVIICADLLIGAVSKIARAYGISSFIIGITVVAFGTSAPELAVGIMSGVQGQNQLTLGNILGSALSNNALIVGLCALFLPLQVQDTVAKREMPMLLLIEATLCVMLLNGNLSRIDGILLLVGFAAFLFYVLRSSKSSARIRIDQEGGIDTDFDNNGLPLQTPAPKKGRQWLLTVVGLAGLFVGGQLTVTGSTQIAQSLGLSQTLIGITVVALATTMPELVASIAAVRKKEPDIVLGNCIGSNIFNILLVLGASSVIKPIAAPLASLWPDMAAMGGVTLLLYLLMRKGKIKRLSGGLLLLLYVGFITYKVVMALAA